MTVNKTRAKLRPLPKTPTGIQGLDEITGGGLPKGRPTLVCGGAGSGKTLLAIEFLVHGAQQFNEPGLFVAFEETAPELEQNVASLGFHLRELVTRKKLLLDHVRVERSEIEETGEYDLEGLFIRLDNAIRTINAKRVVLDTVEALFAGFSNQMTLRAELRRLLRWLKDRGVTTIITGERGDGTLTRQGLEEYVSDCVILLDHRVQNQISTRRLRVVKYRGSTHGSNEYPFLVNETGISVLPITSLGLQHAISNQRVSSGIRDLDKMFGGKGFYRGSSILVSGMAGTGKTSIASSFAQAACRRGERVLYFAFEESPQQIMRNMRSIGIDLKPGVDKGLLKFFSQRATLYGLEMHLATMHKAAEEFQPQIVIMDPVSNFVSVADRPEVKAMLTRLIDFFKTRLITTLFTSLVSGGALLEESGVDISSMMDTWLLLREIESNGERNRGLYVLKSRGMAHSNQIREFLLTNNGVQLCEVHVGPAGIVTGSARLAHEQQQRADRTNRQGELQRRSRVLEHKQRMVDAQIAAMSGKSDAEINSRQANRK